MAITRQSNRATHSQWPICWSNFSKNSKTIWFPSMWWNFYLRKWVSVAISMFFFFLMHSLILATSPRNGITRHGQNTRWIGNVGFASKWYFTIPTAASFYVNIFQSTACSAYTLTVNHPIRSQRDRAQELQWYDRSEVGNRLGSRPISQSFHFECLQEALRSFAKDSDWKL